MVGSPVNPQNHTKKPIKFLCSYGGRILPRYTDGKLRYHGGDTRVISIDRSTSFSELLVKLVEMCGTSVNLRCQLPAEDLDSLVSITSDEDLANLVEEYDRAHAVVESAAEAEEVAPPSSLKIRAFLFAPKTTKKSSPPPSSASSSSNGSSSPKSPFYPGAGPLRCPTSANGRCIRHPSRPPMHPNIGEKSTGKAPYKYVYPCQYHHYPQGYGNGGSVYMIHNSNH